MSVPDINDGEAHIKAEFLLPRETPEERVDEAAKAKDADTEAKEDEGTKEGSEPPTKKQKLTGRNKKRPKLVKTPRGSKLCRHLWALAPGQDAKDMCPFDRCQFSHDLEAFMSAKPEDLGPECHNYRTYGKCPYGLMCRYGGEHIEDSRNKVNQELWAKYEHEPLVTNTLKREVQQALWKRNYEFSQHKEAMRVAQSIIARNKNQAEKNENGKTEENGNAEQNGKTEEEASDGKHVSDEKENGGAGREEKSVGPAPMEDLIRLNSREKKKIDWQDKLYLAPLTTVGNLPFRRVCKRLGADITCGEMALAANLLQGSAAEWALVKRHQSEDLFGIQVCGNNADTMVRCAEMLNRETDVDFVDINMGCPIDLIYKQGSGSALMRRLGLLENMVLGMTQVLDVPLTLKMRTGIYRNEPVATKIMGRAKLWDVSMMTIHGRSKEQRYLKLADWRYIGECVRAADPVPVYGNGDILTYEDYNNYKKLSGVAGVMIARGALIKPWIFQEIKEQKHWDITSGQRYDILKEYVNYGLEHWGSDTEGVEKTRRFLLEWLSFLHRYIPVGVLEQTQRINQRPPLYKGRDHLENLMISKAAADWIKISEMLLGPTPPDFEFLPKHKASSY